MCKSVCVSQSVCSLFSVRERCVYSGDTTLLLRRIVLCCVAWRREIVDGREITSGRGAMRGRIKSIEIAKNSEKELNY